MFDVLTVVIILMFKALVIFLVRVFVGTQSLKKEGRTNLQLLENSLVREGKKNTLYMNKLNLIDQFHESLFNRLFKITREILLLQKLTLDEYP